MRQLKITKQITQRNEESISRYFQEINKISMITAEEEAQLSIRIKNGDEVALEKLVTANLRFVISVAKQYQNQGLAFPDLINEGNYGLIRAAKKFDETRGFKFISYAVWWIRQSILQAIAEQTRIVHLPANHISSIKRISQAIPYLEQEHEREPTHAEIAEYLDLTHDEVNNADFLKQRQVYFDMPLTNKDDSNFNLYDTIQAVNIPAPDYASIRESLETNIDRALGKLTDRETEILSMSFGLKGQRKYTLGDIAEKFEMTRERIRQIRKASLYKLRMLLKSNFVFRE